MPEYINQFRAMIIKAMIIKAFKSDWPNVAYALLNHPVHIV
jgi:hypothetical protein